MFGHTSSKNKPEVMSLWQYLWIKTYSGKKSIIELSFNITMLTDCIKLCCSKISMVEHAVDHAMAYIKLQSV